MVDSRRRLSPALATLLALALLAGAAAEAKIPVHKLYAGPPLPPDEGVVLRAPNYTNIRVWEINGVRAPGWRMGFGGPNAGFVLHLEPGDYALKCSFYGPVGIHTYESDEREMAWFTARAGHELVIFAHATGGWGRGAWTPVIFDVTTRVLLFPPTADKRDPSERLRAMQHRELARKIAAEFPLTDDFRVDSPRIQTTVVEPLSSSQSYSVAAVEVRSPKPIPSEEYPESVRKAMREELFYRGMLAPEDGKATRRLSLALTDFKRGMGRPKIVWNVKVVDALTEEVIGETTINALYLVSAGAYSKEVTDFLAGLEPMKDTVE